MADGPVFITGGAGFIGSHLTDALLAKGHSVRILDDLSTGKRSNLPLDNPKVELISGDVADAALVAQAMRGCSAVAHLAADDVGDLVVEAAQQPLATMHLHDVRTEPREDRRELAGDVAAAHDHQPRRQLLEVEHLV